LLYVNDVLFWLSSRYPSSHSVSFISHFKTDAVIDAHGRKIQGGYLKFLPKFLGWSKLLGQNCQGSLLFCVLLHFYWQVFRKCACCFIPPHPHPILFAPIDAAYLKQSFIFISATSFMVWRNFEFFFLVIQLFSHSLR